jgi:hypothetical protein
MRAPDAARDAPDLAPPFAITVGGVPIDVAADAMDDVRDDNSFPWVGDFDGDGKLDLLIGQHGHGKSSDDRVKSHAGHLRIYRNLGGKGAPRLAQPIWFNDKVPTGRIPAG